MFAGDGVLVYTREHRGVNIDAEDQKVTLASDSGITFHGMNQTLYPPIRE